MFFTFLRSVALSNLSRVRTLVLTSFIAVVSAPATASAFERQWHVGAGAGIVLPNERYRAAGALALHGAYGISDMFDARLELRTSVHSRAGKGVGLTALSQGALGLAYKLDVIEWVPYFGIRAGYYHFSSAPVPPFSERGGMIGAFGGVDYAFSRSVGVGAELDYDRLLPDGGTFAAVLHAEYRWGW